MNILETQYASLFENRFWLQIMGDHARFIEYSLAITETESIQRAHYFIDVFDQLLELAMGQIIESEIDNFNMIAHKHTYDFHEFKLKLLTLTLEGKLRTHLSSTFFNHMLNEIGEYLLILGRLIDHQEILYHPIHYHMLWLLDAIGHASSISANLDEVETDFIDKSNCYEKQFKDLYLKSIEMNGYLRTDFLDFASLGRLNEQAASIMVLFKEFLELIKIERVNARLLGTLMPLMADHMAREECYYLIKLSESSTGTRRTDCDPTRKRIES